MIAPQQPAQPTTGTAGDSFCDTDSGAENSTASVPAVAAESGLTTDVPRTKGIGTVAKSGSPASEDHRAQPPVQESDQRERLGATGSPTSNDSPTPLPAGASRSPAEALGPDLIPVRMLNEFTYCQRLGYLEFVHGEWEDNLETKQGTFGHRRVDKADRKNIEAASQKGRESFSDATTTRVLPASPESTRDANLPSEEKDSRPSALHARSILLSAPDEGLIAKLDLLELDGLKATPVDYKRSKAPKVEGGAYEPERVQLCAQGLILRENGFQCDEGVLYFIASKKRVVIPFTDELIARTRQLRHEFGRVAVQNDVPPPLVDSPKCPRCSLVGICLPDEVNLLQRIDADNPTTPTQVGAPGDVSDQRERQGGDTGLMSTCSPTPTPAGASGNANRSRAKSLLPARHDATPFYVQDFGAMLGKSGDRLQVKKKGEVLGERRLKDVSQVSLFGGVIVSAQALSELMSRGISICHFSHGGWFHGMTSGLVHKNVQLRIRQYQAASQEGEAVLIARQMISGKIRNGRTFLRRHLDSDHKPLLDKLDRYRRKVEATTSLSSLLGIEGMAAKEYFAGLFALLRGRHDFDVNDRNRRPPRDPVNAVLSFAYALLTKELTIVLQSVGFDPMLGLLHQPRYGRPSLALDLAEEYRPLIADSVMMTAFNNGELSSDRFLERAGAVTLTSAGRAAVIAAFERRMATEITHPIFGYRISYRRLLEVQSRLLARTLLGEIDQYPAFCTR